MKIDNIFMPEYFPGERRCVIMYKSRRKRIFAKKTAAVMIAAALITSAILPVASEIAGMSASVMAAGYTAAGSLQTDGDYTYYVNSDGGAVIYKYSGDAEAVVPDKLGGIEVVSLGRGAFSDCTKITLPAVSQLHISSGAFDGCDKLVSIVIPKGAQSLTTEDDAFVDCTSLQSFVNEADSLMGVRVSGGILYDDSMSKLICYPAARTADYYRAPSSVQNVSEYAFRNMKNTAQVLFVDCNSLNELNPAAFNGADNLRHIYLSSSMSVGDYLPVFDVPSLESISVDSSNPYYTSVDGVLYSASGEDLLCYPSGRQQTSFVLPGSVKTVNAESLALNKYLQSITVEGGSSAAFTSADGVLFSENEDGVRTLVSYPAGKTNEAYSVPEGVTQIGSSAFMNNTNLRAVSIAENVNTVCSDAFKNCTSLESVDIGSALQSMPVNPFAGCISLSQIRTTGNETFFVMDNVLYSRTNLTDGITGAAGDVLVFYPMTKTDTSFTVPEGVSRIGTEAFAGNGYLNFVNAGVNVSFIEYGAFSSCTALKNVAFGSSVEFISSKAFSDCISLEQFALPDSLEQLGMDVFSGCEKLEYVSSSGRNIISDNGVLYSADGSELLCYPEGMNRKEFTVPDSVRVINSCVFKNNKFLEILDLGRNLESAEGEIISGCTSLRDLFIHSSTKTIDLTELRGMNGITVYGDDNEEARRFALRSGCNYSGYSSSWFVNASYIDKTQVYTNQAVRLYGYAKGADDSYTYAFEYKTDDEDAFTPIGTKFDGSDTADFVVKTAGKYIIRITAKNEEGKTQEKYFDVNVKGGIANKSYIDKNKIFLGESVNLYGVAKGGSGDYEFEYQYKPSSKNTWTKLKAFSDTKQVTFTPKDSGDYDIYIKSRDSENNYSNKKYTLTVSEVTVLKNYSKLSASSVKVGETIKINAKASGGKAAYKYAFYFRRRGNAKWNTIGTEFGTASVASFKPAGVAIYEIKVDIRDSAGQFASKTLVLSASNGKFENISTISTDFISQENTPIKLRGMAVGGSGSYKYAYYFKRAVNKKWNSLGTVFGTQTSVTLTTTAVTDYDVMISIKDQDGTVLSKTFRISSTIPDELKNNSTVSAEAVNLGNSIRLSGAASGGVSPYKYTYQFKRSINTSWKNIGKADTSSTSATLTPVSAAQYDLRVIVKDAAGKETIKTFTSSAYELVNESLISSETILIGSSATISAKLSGGLGDCRYSYYCKSQNDKEPVLMGEENTENSRFVFTPENAGEYELTAKITDGCGLVSEKTFTVKVNEQLQNTSEINALTIKKGEMIRMTASAVGGIGEYKYAYYYKRSDNTTWTAIGVEFDSRTTETMEPSSVSVYEFKVIVRDNTGKTAEKVFTVNVKSSGSDELPIIPAN